MPLSSSSASMYGSGLVHGWIKNAAGVIYDLDAIMSGDSDAEFDTTEIPGDDVIKFSFNSNQKATLNLKANAFSFDAYAAMTGNAVAFVAATTGGGAHAAYKHTPGGTLSENNPPVVELGLVTQGKDNLGNSGHYVRVFHRVQCKPLKTPQENNTELSIEFAATAFPTSTDVEGNALASQRIDTKYFVDGAWDPASPIFA